MLKYAGFPDNLALKGTSRRTNCQGNQFQVLRSDFGKSCGN